MRLRLHSLLARGLAAALVLTAGVAVAEDPQRGGVMRLKWGTLDTADFHRHTGSISLTHPFAETLTSISADGQPRPMLAESWTVSPDARTYTFKIRQGVKFHDGRVLTAADVMANFERIRREVKGGWLTSALKDVKRFEAPDAATFIVEMEKPFAPFLNLIAEAWILSPASPGWDGQITTPVGTGPFTFDAWTPQIELKGARFADYWMEGKPYLDGVHFDVRETADASLALRAGSYDAASVSLSALKQLEADPAIDVSFRTDTSWYFVSFNNRAPRPPFDDIRVRRAIAHALDKQTMMTLLAGDRGQVTNQMTVAGNFFHDDALEQADIYRKPDLALAKAMLAEAGVNPGDVTVQMVSEPDSRLSGPVAQTLTQLGFKVDNRAYDDLGYQRRLSAYDWDIFPGGSGPRNDIFLRYVRFMSDGPNTGLWGGVQDPELDALITAAISTADKDESRRQYSAAWRRIMDRHYTVVLGHAPAPYGIRTNVRDFTVAFNTSAHRVDGGLAFAWIAK